MNPRVQSRPESRAFTLLEVLLAVAVFSIVLVAIHLVFHGALRLRNRAVERMESEVPLHQALEIIRRDLSQLAPPGGRLTGSSSSSIVAVSSNVTAGVEPEFYTTSGRLDEEWPWGDIQRVTYRLADSTNDAWGRDLYRVVTRNLLSTMEDTPEEQWLLGGVDSLRFLVFDGYEWRELLGDVSDTNTPPLALKVEIELVHTNGAAQARRAPLEVLVPVDVQARTTSTDTNTTSTAGGGAS